VYRRATYYLRPDQIRALKLRAVMEERTLSEVTREAVDRYLRDDPRPGGSPAPSSARRRRSSLLRG